MNQSERERYKAWLSSRPQKRHRVDPPRLKRIGKDVSPWEVWQAAACVLPDDDEPVTAEWWRGLQIDSRWFQVEFCEKTLRLYFAGMRFCEVKTRRDVRQLCRALGIELKEGKE